MSEAEWMRAHFMPARYLLNSADWCAVKHVIERRLKRRFTWKELSELFCEVGIRGNRGLSGDWVFCANPESPFFKKYRFTGRKKNA